MCEMFLKLAQQQLESKLIQITQGVREPNGVTMEG